MDDKTKALEAKIEALELVVKSLVVRMGPETQHIVKMMLFDVVVAEEGIAMTALKDHSRLLPRIVEDMEAPRLKLRSISEGMPEEFYSREDVVEELSRMINDLRDVRKRIERKIPVRDFS